MKNLIKQPHLIFSMENPRYQVTQKDINHGQALNMLKDLGENTIDSNGKYGSEEPSIIVSNPKNVKDIIKLARDAGQESIIYSDGKRHKMIYLNGPQAGQTVNGEGTVFYNQKPNDNYTHFKDQNGKDIYFTHNFDFGKSEKLQKTSKINLNPEHGKIIANAYEKMKHDPNDPKVKEAYGALINETKKQFKDMLNSGFKFSKIKPEQSNPYGTSKDVHEDIEKNKHLWFFPTEQGFGQEGQTKNHPMLESTEFQFEGKPLLANDLFRIVHDYRGHYLGGKSSFGPKGEHQAYLTHKKDFSPLAQKALATETMGQNNWVNFGPYGEKNRKNPENTTYAEQKSGLLPDEIINGRWHE
jgi:hypothetical protein